MKEASYYQPQPDGKVQCVLCPHNCLIANQKRGICRVRINIDGKLFTENYGKLCSIRLDPVEKKPLYHFFPGKQILSVGSIGCNLKCRFCQNYDISQSSVGDFTSLKEITPAEVVAIAENSQNNCGIAYTYNEPVVWFEYMIEIARLAKLKNIRNVMITNGFINKNPMSELLEVIDAFNVDLKAFDEKFYHDLTSSLLEPVKNTLKQIRNAGKHLEINNLVISNQNDNPLEFEEMVKWISGELGKETVLHISRYYPVYKLKEPATSPEKMAELLGIARKYLDYVYPGNISLKNESNTFCPACGNELITRTGYQTVISGLDAMGNCGKCEKRILLN